MVALVSYAQIQQGIVKTRGRIVNGKLVAGMRLSGVTIKLNYGNPLVSSNQGTFSFHVPAAESFSLLNVNKKGYVLADPEYIKRSFFYSATNPFYVVLEDEKQHQNEIIIATRNLRRTLISKLQACENEIDSLKNKNIINEQEYQIKLKELNNKMSKSDELIRGMAKHFVSIDFDQLDSINAKISYYIQSGDLYRADSLINLQNNLDESIEKLKQHKKAVLEAKEYVRREQKNVAERIIQKRDIAILSNNDEEIEKYSFALADLDTTCAEYQIQVINTLWYRYDLDLSRIYNRLINIAEINNDLISRLYWLLDMAESYYYTGYLQKCKDLYDKVISIADKHDINVTMLKQSYRLTKVYILYRDYEQVLNIHKKGIIQFSKETYLSEKALADEFINAAHALCLMGRYKEAITYYQEALSQIETTKNKWYKSACLFYIAYTYERLGKKRISKKLYKESFTIRDSSKDYSHYSIIDFKKEFYLTNVGFYGYCWPNEILLEVCDSYIENGEYILASKVCDTIEEEFSSYNNNGEYETPYTKELELRRDKIRQ